MRRRNVCRSFAHVDVNRAKSQQRWADIDATADILNQGTQAARRRPTASSTRSKPAETRSRERGCPEPMPADQRQLNVAIMRDCMGCDQRKSDTRHVLHSGLDREGYMCFDCRYVPLHHPRAALAIHMVNC
jgi:hypothetical protein